GRRGGSLGVGQHEPAREQGEEQRQARRQSSVHGRVFLVFCRRRGRPGAHDLGYVSITERGGGSQQQIRPVPKAGDPRATRNTRTWPACTKVLCSPSRNVPGRGPILSWCVRTRRAMPEPPPVV